MILSSTLLLVVGLLVLAYGGDLLLRGAVALATLARLTPAVVGLTVVAIGTSVPELAVSLSASLRNQSDIAVGNVVGSNIFNIAGILGVTSLVRPVTISGRTIRLEFSVLTFLTLTYLLFASDGQIDRVEGIFFLFVYILFTACVVRLVRRDTSKKEDEPEERKENPQASESVGKSSFLTIAGIALLGAGANLAVNGAVGLANQIGLSERTIGLTIVSFGTSLPELITSIVAIRRQRDDVVTGNIIGSNLFNIAGILGIAALISPVSINPNIVRLDNWWMLGFTLVFFLFVFTGRRINRLEGMILSATYMVYIATLLLNSDGVG